MLLCESIQLLPDLFARLLLHEANECSLTIWGVMSEGLPLISIRNALHSKPWVHSPIENNIGILPEAITC